jgi:demethylmenaquinone methyltransferase/2-methoxy-6-polyprenyl-1,4-benzoquinol methylase
MLHENTPSGRIDTLITADENRVMFDRISTRYDLANRLMSFGLDRRWRRKAVAALSPAGDGRYLDIGTGTGDVAFEILRRAPGASVVGVDPSPGMLAVARGKADTAACGTLSFRNGDALALEFEDGSFDGVISAFCFRNIENRVRALGEMRRVLRPGGRLVLLELTHPASRWIRLGYGVYVPLVRLVGRAVGSRSAYRYLLDSIAAFPRPEQVKDMLQSSAFAEACYCPLSGGVVCVFSGVKGDA